MVDSECGSCIVTWRCRVIFSVTVAEMTTSGGVSSALTWRLREDALTRLAHAWFPCFKQKSVRIVRSEYEVERGETIFKAARHRWRLCPVESQTQQWPLCWTLAWKRAYLERRGGVSIEIS